MAAGHLQVFRFKTETQTRCKFDTLLHHSLSMLLWSDWRSPSENRRIGCFVRRACMQGGAGGAGCSITSSSSCGDPNQSLQLSGARGALAGRERLGPGSKMNLLWKLLALRSAVSVLTQTPQSRSDFISSEHVWTNPHLTTTCDVAEEFCRRYPLTLPHMASPLYFTT